MLVLSVQSKRRLEGLLHLGPLFGFLQRHLQGVDLLLLVVAAYRSSLSRSRSA
jgi:hypothetical protein